MLALLKLSYVTIAAELAMHFEQAQDHKRATKYLQHAADNAVQRFAYGEAVKLARKGLYLLRTLPEDRERAERELRLQLTLGVPLIASQGYAAPQVGGVYMRARELCRQLGETTDVSEAVSKVFLKHNRIFIPEHQRFVKDAWV